MQVLNVRVSEAVVPNTRKKTRTLFFLLILVIYSVQLIFRGMKGAYRCNRVKSFDFIKMLSEFCFE